jgi:hypothetical protein
VGSFLFGKNPALLDPCVSGNGIQFNTVTDATLETLQPTTLLARQSLGVFLSAQKTFSVSSDIPYQPALFAAFNTTRAWNATSMLKQKAPQSLGGLTVYEFGLGINNLFVFPLPVLRPSIGVGYYYGIYPSALKDLNSGSLKFTLRFFN